MIVDYTTQYRLHYDLSVQTSDMSVPSVQLAPSGPGHHFRSQQLQLSVPAVRVQILHRHLLCRWGETGDGWLKQNHGNQQKIWGTINKPKKNRVSIRLDAWEIRCVAPNGSPLGICITCREYEYPLE